MSGGGEEYRRFSLLMMLLFYLQGTIGAMSLFVFKWIGIIGSHSGEQDLCVLCGAIRCRVLDDSVAAGYVEGGADQYGGASFESPTVVGQ